MILKRIFSLESILILIWVRFETLVRIPWSLLIFIQFGSLSHLDHGCKKIGQVVRQETTAKPCSRRLTVFEIDDIGAGYREHKHPMDEICLQIRHAARNVWLDFTISKMIYRKLRGLGAPMQFLLLTSSMIYPPDGLRSQFNLIAYYSKKIIEYKF